MLLAVMMLSADIRTYRAGNFCRDERPCACADGKGTGSSQGNNLEPSRLAGKCVARAILGLLKGLTSPEIFRQVTWENGVRTFKCGAQKRRQQPDGARLGASSAHAVYFPNPEFGPK
ncbi:MAG: hypothetical protein WB676_12375 [Bryobacteraceae bacterium]